jgi:hypothetical protein
LFKEEEKKKREVDIQQSIASLGLDSSYAHQINQSGL